MWSVEKWTTQLKVTGLEENNGKGQSSQKVLSSSGNKKKVDQKGKGKAKEKKRKGTK